MQPRDLAAYLFLAVGWGLSFLVLLKAIAGFGWVGAVSFRALIASFTLFAVARLAGRQLNFAGMWKPLCVVGATTVAGQLIGMTYATPRIGTAGKPTSSTMPKKPSTSPPRPLQVMRSRPQRRPMSIENSGIPATKIAAMAVPMRGVA